MDFKMHLELAWNKTMKHLAPLIMITLVMVVVSFCTLGILAPVMMAGYTQALLMLIRQDRQPQIQDLFSQMGIFLPLLGFSIVAGLVIVMGLNLFVLPGLAVIGALTFGCIYMLPLMTDRRMGMVDAVKASWRLAMQDNVADQVVVAILYLGFIAIGVSVFIPLLLTLPFASVLVLSVYQEKAKVLDTAAAGA